jgi:hypothetical protein
MGSKFGAQYRSRLDMDFTSRRSALKSVSKMLPSPPSSREGMILQMLKAEFSWHRHTVPSVGVGGGGMWTSVKSHHTHM